MLTPETIMRIGEFMGRVELKATEIAAYQHCMSALQEKINAIARQPQMPTTVPEC